MFNVSLRRIAPVFLMIAILLGACVGSGVTQGANAAPALAQPQATVMGSSDAPAKQMPGFIRDWYGFSKLPYDGAGQTVAIIGTGDYQDAASDLAVFINTYGTGNMHGLSDTDPCTVQAGPHPCFQRVRAPSNTVKYPDLYWSGGTHYHIEAAGDVQWAHVVAPGADILFVDAATPVPDDIMGAVDVAVAHGSSVVSISLGWEQSAADAAREMYFTNHPGFVFVASSGDNYYGDNLLYPGASPNVLSVGGTTLSFATGHWTEVAWGAFDSPTNRTGPFGSTGGLSQFDPIPAYQKGFHSSANRGVPDVAYAADWAWLPTYVLGTYYQLGGTSMGAPQWAGLIALANQARAANGQPSLTGVAPFYDAAKTAGNYRDIVAGTGACVSAECAAGPGYDYATGLGVPRADKLVPFLAGVVPVEVAGVSALNPGLYSAAITWTTSTAATSQVCYSTTAGGPYVTCTTPDMTLNTAHKVAVSGLTAGQAYFYVVKGQDGASYPYSSSEASFKTRARVVTCATWACAVAITQSSTGAYNAMSGTIAKSYTSQFLKFEGSAGTTYRISVAIDGDASVYVYDPNQKLINVFGGGGGSSTTWKNVTVPADGLYYVLVQNAKSPAKGPLHYTLNMVAR